MGDAVKDFRLQKMGLFEMRNVKKARFLRNQPRTPRSERNLAYVGTQAIEAKAAQTKASRSLAARNEESRLSPLCF
jgi:hypothetical protein